MIISNMSSKRYDMNAIAILTITVFGIAAVVIVNL